MQRKLSMGYQTDRQRRSLLFPPLLPQFSLPTIFRPQKRGFGHKKPQPTFSHEVYPRPPTPGSGDRRRHPGGGAWPAHGLGGMAHSARCARCVVWCGGKTPRLAPILPPATSERGGGGGAEEEEVLRTAMPSRRHADLGGADHVTVATLKIFCSIGPLLSVVVATEARRWRGRHAGVSARERGGAGKRYQGKGAKTRGEGGIFGFGVKSRTSAELMLGRGITTLNSLMLRSHQHEN
ncbi:hypothetical protein QBC33DRAFT_224607 [Phialemonium atrogriseum]|uniref:Uncharacterized protein n=1 Tax=Phialemonium atrogriseum TaxID=1093897 RepID=A0AAJ0C7J5_9PEZI|nr:uncharacterized protein QBC33DRAFT_224607 [Phialemonium atrogriseum]KAK1770972.1 hypothetical protein QBC33DRAFT_224607 [Phialemonium atrogriseum]